MGMNPGTCLNLLVVVRGLQALPSYKLVGGLTFITQHTHFTYAEKEEKYYNTNLLRVAIIQTLTVFHITCLD
jgi:hypothetical protein